jgi:hypothetical protein
VSETEPHAAGGVEAHDLNANPGAKILQELLRQAVRALCVLADESRSFPPFLFLQRLHALIRERLGAGGSAWLQDRREKAEQLDSRRPG